MNLLTVKNLSVQVKNKCLLKPISFQLNQQERLVILGQTGAGKSLIAQAIMGNLSKQLSIEGEISLFGGAVKEQSSQRRLWGNKMSILPQEPWNALDPLMPIKNQLASTYHFVAGHAPQEADQQADNRLRSLGLEQSTRKRVDELSGGMAQRVALACAMAGGAPLLLADEPTKGLDVSRRDQVVQQLLEQTEAGALLLITHDVEVARQIDSKVMVIKDGELVEEGNNKNIFLHANHEYTRALIAADPQRWEQPKASNNVAALTSSPVLSSQQLSIGRGKQVLQSKLSLTVHAGEVIGVVGDSGCGKSTLGDTLLGLLPPLSGKITRHAQAEAHRWQKLYQDPTAAVPHSASLQVLLNDIVKKYRIEDSAIQALMERLELDKTLLQRSASHVSGGELQRFCLLRALLLKPVFLFADEPTSRLDPITAKDVSALLVDIAKETQCAMMLVSHDHTMIKKRCDQVLTIGSNITH